MSETGYIKLSRRFFDNFLWLEERVFTKAEAWIDLIASARFEVTPGRMLVGQKMVTWNRGQLPASYRFLAVRWGWSTKKVGKFLELLQNEGMITYETPKETGQSLVTICKYDDYNRINKAEETPKETGRKQQGNAKETARKQEGNKTNKEEESKEGKEDISPIPPYPDFENYALDKSAELEIEIDPAKLKAKYIAWVEGGWRTGKGAKIKNWKTTLLNTLNYLKKEKSSAKKERGPIAAIQAFSNTTMYD